MKAKELIEQERIKIQQLYNSHKLWEETKGEQGLKCLSPEKVEKMLDRTDKEIIQAGLDAGLWIEDAEMYID